MRDRRFGGDLAVEKADDAVGAVGDGLVVGDHDDGLTAGLAPSGDGIEHGVAAPVAMADVLDRDLRAAPLISDCNGRRAGKGPVDKTL